MGDQVDAYSPIVFVTGTGRSGTNITKNIFAQHSKVATLPFEHRFTIDPRGVVDFYRSYPQQWSPYWCDFKVKELTKYLRSLGEESPERDERSIQAKEIDPTGLKQTGPSYAGWSLAKWFPNYFEAIDQLEASLVDFDHPGRWPGSEEGVKNNKMAFATRRSQEELKPLFQRFLNQLSEGLLHQQRKDIFLEDNTHSLLYASTLAVLYPNAKFIHMIRDPRDVIASLMNQPWCPNDLDQLLSWYMEVWKTWESERSSLAQGALLEIRLEDLIRDTKNTLERISAFIGVDLEDKLFDIALDAGHEQRYKTSFTPKEVVLIERATSRIMEQYGY